MKHFFIETFEKNSTLINKMWCIEIVGLWVDGIVGNFFFLKAKWSNNPNNTHDRRVLLLVGGLEIDRDRCCI